jgi:hypothetical protein
MDRMGRALGEAGEEGRTCRILLSCIITCVDENTGTEFMILVQPFLFAFVTESSTLGPSIYHRDHPEWTKTVLRILLLIEWHRSIYKTNFTILQLLRRQAIPQINQDFKEQSPFPVSTFSKT